MKSFTKRHVLIFIGLLLAATPLLAQSLNLPARPANAKTGTEFYNSASTLSVAARENLILTEIMSGNVPNFIRTLRPITVTTTISAQSHTVTYYVTPEYMALGTDTDYFLMPMSPLLAQKIADRLNCNLPTRKMVNDIWSQAVVKLSPSTIPPSAEMITLPVMWTHNTTVRQQRAGSLGTNPLGALVGGHKKDVVVTALLSTKTASVAIYGWHYLSGTPIQPLYTGHENTYADYSHGIRLVLNAMTLDGTSTTVPQLLQHPTLNPILSDEGIVTTYRYNVPLPAYFPIIDSFPSTGRQQTSWTNKYTTPTTISFSPTSPGGDGYIIVVKDPSGGMESTRIGNLTDSDYYVQSDIYCNYRPGLSSDGYERVGLFIRDNGNGSFEHTTGGGGYNYFMAWDSNNGRIWCAKTINGVITDLNPSPVYQASAAWRRMRIEASGSQLTFKCDGTTICATTDTTYNMGQCGDWFP